jgi:Protein of unknwon function (DUF3310)
MEMDNVNNPKHYTQGGIECIDYIKQVLTPEEFRGYLRGCIIKYQHRLMLKANPPEDAAKMNWYTARLTELLKKGTK